MAWDFETEPYFQEKLDWVADFVRNDVEPLDHVLGSQYDVKNSEFVRLVRPLQAKVKAEALWACHLGPELGGPGYGQVKLGLLNGGELGRGLAPLNGRLVVGGAGL